MLKLLQYCNYVIVVMQIKLMLLVLLLVEKVMVSFHCHSNTNVNETWSQQVFIVIIITQLWYPFSDIFVNASVLNTQTQEVHPL